jgi:dethiobiotin synthetase
MFVTGIGTGVGKTVVSAILTEALGADYWKPIQSGLEGGTDTETVKTLVSNDTSRFHEELYSLNTPASPHLAARIDNVHIELDALKKAFDEIRRPDRHLVVEGAGGLMVPLNERHFYPDLIQLLQIPVVVVSSQYLGNINHSMLTAEVLKMRRIPVLGWVFNGTYHINEEDIIRWSGLDSRMVSRYAEKLRPRLLELLGRI